jgi:hypothetical protein
MKNLFPEAPADPVLLAIFPAWLAAAALPVDLTHQASVFRRGDSCSASSNRQPSKPEGIASAVDRRPSQTAHNRLTETRQLQVVEAAERLRGILAPMASGGASLPAMAADLQTAGVKTTTGKATWAPMQVKRALERLELR